VIKHQFIHVKVRFRGLMKNTAEMTTLFALLNLWMAGKRLMGMGVRADAELPLWPMPH
jgi:IS5 family transposase